MITRSRIVLAWTVAICLVATSCASSTETSLVEPASTAPQISEPPATAIQESVESRDTQPEQPADEASYFPEISLANTSVEELDRVRLAGLASDQDLSALAVMIVIGDVAVPVAVLTDEDGPYFVAPLNPEAPGTDGSVEVFITNGENDGRRLLLALTGLPPAPGAGAEYAQAMRESVDAQAKALGSSFAELQAIAFADTPPQLEQLKLLQGLIDDGTTDDLVSALSADESGLTADQMALVDAIVAKTDPQASIKPPPPPASAPPLPPPPPPPPGSSTQSADVTIQITPGTDTDCNSSDIPTIGTAADLDMAMQRGISVRQQLTGATGTVLTDIKNTLLQGSLIPTAGPIIGTVGAVFTTAFLGDAPDAGRYPTALSDLNATITPETFDEDFGTDGSWSNVRVSASSTGYNGTADLIGLAVDGIGIVTGAASAKNLITNSDVGLAVDVSGKTVNSATGQFLASDAGPTFARFCSHTWTVPLKDNTYLAGARSSLKTLSVDDDTRTFAPNKVGDDQLVLTTKGFPGTQVSVSTPITTHQTFVQLEPNDVEVEAPGDVVDIDVNFVHSETEHVMWETTGGSFVDGLGDVTMGIVSRQLETPGSAEAFDITVTATLATEQGLFVDGRMKPSDATAIRVANMIVSPEDATLVTGASLQYTATTPAGDSIDVEWHAGGGSISSQGLYIAGDQTGTYTVTATAVADGAITDSVQVTIEEAPDPACLHGVWRLRLDEMAEQMSRLTPDGSFVFVSGEYQVSLFPDGTWNAERRGLVFEIIAQGQTATMRIESAESGSYEATDALLTITETSSNASATLTFPGIGEIGGPVPDGSSFAGSGVYTCADGVFTVTADGFTATHDYVGPTS